jgi:hypothetical protein
MTPTDLETSLSLQDFYLEAKNLRSQLRDSDDGVKMAAAQRFTNLSGLDAIPAEEIPDKKISLNQAKQVIAQERGQESWGHLKIHLAEKVQAIQEKCEALFVPGQMPNEAGEVISNDIIFLGTFAEQSYAIDAILMDLYAIAMSEHGPGYEVRELDPVDFDPDAVPDIPEDDNEWGAWGVSMAKVMGLL